jgi:hypothetical protein
VPERTGVNNVTLQSAKIYLPSPAALQQIYICTFSPEQQIRETTPHTGVEMVSYLFTGQFIANEVYSNDHFAIAFSVGGVCVYSTLLKAFDSSPIDATSTEIIPGHIKYRESTGDNRRGVF